MAISRTLLTALAACLTLAGSDALAAGISCLKCHPQHYREMGSCVGCHGGDPRSDRLRIAHHDLVAARFSWHGIPNALPVQRGGKLLEGLACRRCHTTGGKGNRLASNLDRLPAGTDPEQIFASIAAPALLMPQFRLERQDITDLVNAILSGAKKTAQNGAETPQVVHFASAGNDVGNIFEKKCGACHRVLTGALGALGRGSIAPNLSGLFSGFYPPTAAGQQRWSAQPLEKWLENPRKTRPVTRMRPVPMEEREFRDLLALLQPEPGRQPGAGVSVGSPSAPQQARLRFP